MSRRRLIRGVGANVFDRIVMAAMQLALVPVQLSHWGVHVYGLWVLIFTVPAFLSFSDFGFASAAGTTMTMQIARGEREAAVATLHSARVAILFSSTSLVILTVAIVWALPDAMITTAEGFTRTELRTALSVLIVYSLVALQATTTSAAFRAVGMYSTAAMAHALIVLWESACMIAVILFFRGGPVAAACAVLAGRVTGTMIQAEVLRRRVIWLHAGYRHWSAAEARTLLAPAAGVMALSIAQASFLQGTAMALGAAASAMAVPVFTTLRTLSRLGLSGTSLLNSALMPEFSAATARGDRRGQARMVALTLISSALVIVPFAAVLALFGVKIVTIWTHGLIVPSVALVVVMAAGILVSGFWTPVSNLLVAMNLQALFTYRYLLLALASIALTYALARLLGALGAAIALLTLECIMAATVARLTARHIVSGAVVYGAVRELSAEGIAMIRGLARRNARAGRGRP